MNNMPKVSVVVSTYNRPKFIGVAIKSVLSQTYQNFELVIIDDSPNEETEKIVKAFGNPQIKYIRNKIRTNLPSGRNQGVRESSPDSKYIAFLDDDNELLPLFLEKSIQVLEEKKELTGVIPEVRHLFDDGIKIGRSIEVKKCWNTGMGNGAVLRKKLFTKENIWFDEKLRSYEDWDFGIRVLKKYRVESIPKILQIYHHHPVFKGSTLSTAPLSADTINYLFQKHISYYSLLGKKPLSVFYHWLGILYCRNGNIKNGKCFFSKSFLNYPRLIYALYYILWSFPKFAQRFYFENLLYKILKIKNKFYRKLINHFKISSV